MATVDEDSVNTWLAQQPADVLEQVLQLLSLEIKTSIKGKKKKLLSALLVHLAGLLMVMGGLVHTLQ